MAFSLSGILSLDNSAFVRGIRGAESSTYRFTSNLKSAALGIGALVGVSFGIQDTIKTFADFEKEMSNVKAITGETSNLAMEGLTEKAKEMGRILPASASDAAQAMANLGSAGFSTNEIMDSVEGTLYLATSAQTDMATAADISSSTLRGFGLEASKAGHVADVLAKTAASTNAGIIDMGESLKYASPVAKAMGISLEETTAAIGLMANAGIKGSQSGTTLRGAMIRLTKPAKPAIAAMESLGFSAFDSTGKMKPLGTIIGELQSKTKNLTQENRNSAIATIFGTEALSGMLALMDAGPDKINALTASLVSADGASKQMAETQTNNLYGAMQELEGAWETAQINIGQQAAPAITNAFKSMADALPGVVSGGLDLVNSAFGFIKDNKDIIIAGIAGITAAFTVQKVAALGAAAAEGILTATQWLLNVAMGANPIGAVTLLIAGLVTGLVYAYRKFEGFRKVVDGAWAALKRLFGFKGKTIEAPTVTQKPIDKNANGTSYFSGGSSLINERGSEMIVSRGGEAIIPAERTERLLNSKSMNSGNNININIDAKGMNVSELVTELKLRLANV